jgi:preprotein translocase subunit SecF
MSITTFVSAVVAMVVFGIAFYTGYEYGSNKQIAYWTQQKSIIEEEHNAALEKSRKAEQTAQTIANQVTQERTDAYSAINRLSSTIASSLRNRQERVITTAETSRVPENTCACGPATGAELARGDAEFLAGYATDAAKTRAELDSCQKQYNEVRRLFNGEN